MALWRQPALFMAGGWMYDLEGSDTRPNVLSKECSRESLGLHEECASEQGVRECARIHQECVKTAPRVRYGIHRADCEDSIDSSLKTLVDCGQRLLEEMGLLIARRQCPMGVPSRCENGCGRGRCYSSGLHRRRRRCRQCRRSRCVRSLRRLGRDRFVAHHRRCYRRGRRPTLGCSGLCVQLIVAVSRRAADAMPAFSRSR